MCSKYHQQAEVEQRFLIKGGKVSTTQCNVGKLQGSRNLKNKFKKFAPFFIGNCSVVKRKRDPITITININITINIILEQSQANLVRFHVEILHVGLFFFQMFGKESSQSKDFFVSAKCIC